MRHPFSHINLNEFVSASLGQRFKDTFRIFYGQRDTRIPTRELNLEQIKSAGQYRVFDFSEVQVGLSDVVFFPVTILEVLILRSIDKTRMQARHMSPFGLGILDPVVWAAGSIFSAPFKALRAIPAGILTILVSPAVLIAPIFQRPIKKPDVIAEPDLIIESSPTHQSTRSDSPIPSDSSIRPDSPIPVRSDNRTNLDREYPVPQPTVLKGALVDRLKAEDSLAL